MAVRAFCVALLPRRADLCATEMLEAARPGGRRCSGNLGRGQRRKPILSFCHHSRLAPLRGRGRHFLAGKPTPGNPGRPPSRSFVWFLGSSLVGASLFEGHTRTSGLQLKRCRHGPVRVCGHAHGHGAVRRREAADRAQHAGALQPQPGHLEFCGRRNPAHALASSGPRPRGCAPSRGRAFSPPWRPARPHLRRSGRIVR